ncbi:MAG: class I adenylate-forming enzyme family protein [Planctomycetales bacterium]
MADGPGLSAVLLLVAGEGLPPAAEMADRILPAATGGGGLAGLFHEVAYRSGQLPAITTPNGAWSYTRLLAAAQTVAAALRSEPAFHPGARVVLLLANSAEYAAAFYGVLLAGGVVVPLPPRTEASGLQAILDSTDAVVAIATGPVVRQQAALHLIPAKVVNLAQPPVEESQLADAPCTRSGAELAAIFFTAGSTGTPKGVMLSHDNLSSNAQSIQEYLRIDAGERPLCVLPFYHAFGNSVLQSHLLAGAHLIIDGQTAFPETIIASLARHQATSLSGVPDLFRVLLDRTSLGVTPLPALRYMAVAGGSLRHELSLEVARRIEPGEFVVMYGQTEATARLAYVPPDHLSQVPAGSIGRAIPGVTLEVVDEQGIPLPTGQVGELRARGPGIMLGYWRDAAGTTDRLREGWLYTGDLASIDAEGWISHCGRRNALVKIAGFRVHPADLEDFAVRRLAARQAVAVPFEAPDLGTRLALYLAPVATGGLGLSEMLARCRAELPRHLVPDFIRIVDEFPLNHAMKIDRPELTRLAESDVQRRRASA